MKRLPHRNQRKSPDPTGERPTMAKQRRHLKLVSGKAPRQRCTLLDLVQRIQDTGRGDEEIVATIAQLIESGEVVLCGAFAGSSIKPFLESSPGSEAAAVPDATAVRFAR
jgi:hypothetical protein